MRNESQGQKPQSDDDLGLPSGIGIGHIIGNKTMQARDFSILGNWQ
jgi:hypothetical protein